MSAPFEGLLDASSYAGGCHEEIDDQHKVMDKFLGKDCKAIFQIGK
jgi:hypothetical protein